MYPSSSTQQPAAICALKSPADAIHILEAVRLGLVPRVTRRLTGHERSMIRPGTVWVWEEEETNMRRWTDGRRWGASRVGGGGYLVYTESSDNLSPPPARDRASPNDYAHRPPSAPYGALPRASSKSESLIKQTYSTTMTHPVTGKAKKFHVVAYSSKGDAHDSLPLPHQLPLLASLNITPGIWPEWEHRNDPEFLQRRGTSFPPGPLGSGPTPTTAMVSPDQSDFSGRGRSPKRDLYTQQTPLAPPPHFPHPYATPPYPLSARDPYASRPPSYPPPPHSHPRSERYHPYHDPSRSRQSYRPVPPLPSSSTSSSSNPIPAPSTPQDAYYEAERRNIRDERYPPRLSPADLPYHPGYNDAYYRGAYSPGRESYYEDYPRPSPYYENPDRSPQDKEWDREDHSSQTRHHSAPTHLVSPPTSTDRQSVHGKSPKMSIGANLLNPQPTSEQTGTPTSAGVTGELDTATVENGD